MQIERLHERVSVRADFRGGVITPVVVARSSGERQTIETVTGRWIDRSGGGSSGSDEQEERGRSAGGVGRGVGRKGGRGAPCYHFTVTMAGATYELAFDADVPEWWIERVMIE